MTILESIEKKIVPWNEIAGIRSAQKGKTVVFTNGCFDILHPGHITYLAMARELGDVLWLGLNSDESVGRLKGPARPVNPAGDRALILAAMVFIDFVTVFTEDTPVKLIGAIQPDIHTKGGDYKKEDLPEFPVIAAYGGRVEIIPFVPGKSTSAIIQKINSTGK